MSFTICNASTNSILITDIFNYLLFYNRSDTKITFVVMLTSVFNSRHEFCEYPVAKMRNFLFINIINCNYENKILANGVFKRLQKQRKYMIIFCIQIYKHLIKFASSEFKSFNNRYLNSLYSPLYDVIKIHALFSKAPYIILAHMTYKILNYVIAVFVSWKNL